MWMHTQAHLVDDVVLGAVGRLVFRVRVHLKGLQQVVCAPLERVQCRLLHLSLADTLTQTVISAHLACTPVALVSSMLCLQ